MAQAMEWVARITTVALEMVLPGLAGVWLDKQLATGVFALIGFGLGMVVGIWHLLVMTGSVGKNKSKSKNKNKNGSKKD